MRERGIAKRRSQRRCNCYEEQRNEDAPVGEDGFYGRAFGVVAQVCVANERSEEGLEGVEEDGEFEQLGCFGRAVGSGS
jgi:hypothetical protein